MLYQLHIFETASYLCLITKHLHNLSIIEKIGLKEAQFTIGTVYLIILRRSDIDLTNKNNNKNAETQTADYKKKPKTLKPKQLTAKLYIKRLNIWKHKPYKIRGDLMSIGKLHRCCFIRRVARKSTISYSTHSGLSNAKKQIKKCGPNNWKK